MRVRTIGGLALGAAVGFAVIAAVYLIPQPSRAATPEEVSREFYLASYTRNFSSAWDRVSSVDQFALGKDQYLASNLMPSEVQAALLDQLADWGEFETVAITSSDPSRAVVSVHVRFPQLEQREIEELLSQGAEPDAELAELLQNLVTLNEADQLQFREADISFDLISEGGRWRVIQNWGQSVMVHLGAAVSEDLPWDFYPVVDEISARPGELVAATYIARNNSERTITAKAIHEVSPEQSMRFFQTVQCFCFTEQTLEPGEEREMVLLFSIDTITPRDLASLENLYTFYTLESFPSES